MEKLEIGQTYITKIGHIKQLVRISNGIAFFNNLSKDFDDDWRYEKDGTYKLGVSMQEHNLKTGWMKVFIPDQDSK